MLMQQKTAKTIRLSIYLSTKKIIQFLLIIVLGLHLINLSFKILEKINPNSILIKLAVKLFDVDGEGNIPAFYSAATLLICAILLAVITTIKRQTKDSYFWHWGGLSIIFLFLTWDEAVQIHEKLMNAPMLYKILDWLKIEASGLLNFPWVIVGILAVIVVFIIYWKFLLSLPRKLQRLFIIAASLYVGGAIGMEMIGGLVLGNSSHLDSYQNNILYILSISLEEILEMLGVILLIYSLLKYISSLLEKITINIGK